MHSHTTPSAPLPLGHLAWFSALLPLVTMHLSWLLASWEGYIHWCVPYWADCTSISKTGRNGLAYFVFKGGMIATATQLVALWILNRHGLRSLGAGPSRLMPVLGTIASVALLTYTLSLGHAGDTFRLLRRFGVVAYLGLSFILLAITAHHLLSTRLRRSGQKMLAYSAALLAIALFSLVLDAWMGSDYDRIEDAFEWWLILLLNLQLFWLARLWKGSELAISIKPGTE